MSGLRGASLKFINTNLNGYDADKLKTVGLHLGANWVNAANSNWSIILVLHIPSDSYPFQLQIVNTWTSSFKMYARICSDTTWGDWKQFSFL